MAGVVSAGTSRVRIRNNANTIKEVNSMEFFIFAGACFVACFVIMALNEVAKELRGIRTVFETQYQLERVPVRSEGSYKRKGVEL